MVAVRRAGWWLVAVLSVSVALVSTRYLLGVGPLADGVMANLFARPWLFVHAASAATALLVGAFQFLPALRNTPIGTHRWLGRAYVAGCLVGGVSGLVLAFGSTAGPVATAGFGSLAVAWIAVTLQGWRLAMMRDFARHRRWMIRSWSLMLAAVTLRIYLPLVDPLGIDFVQCYRAISFISWVPNLILAEFYLAWPLVHRRRALA